MEVKDKKEFARLLWMFANDACVKVSKEQLSVKFEMLKQFPLKAVAKACLRLLNHREQKWPVIPTLPEFIAIIESSELKSLGLDNTAEMQAVIVIKKLKHEGRAGKIDFEDPITKSIMTDRWPYNSWASTVIENEIKWWKKDFITLYKSYNKHGEVGLLTVSPGGKMISTRKLKSLAGKSVKPVVEEKPISLASDSLKNSSKRG